MSYDDTCWALLDFNDPKPKPPEPVAKGQCPKCGKMIGRGLHFHVRACTGHDDTRDA